MSSLLQKYGIGFAAIIGLLSLFIALVDPKFAAPLTAGGVWFGSALISAHICTYKQRNS